MNRFAQLAIPFVLAVLFAPPANAGDLEITIKGIRSDQGRVYVAVHAPRAGVKFPDDAGAVTGLWRLARPGELHAAIRDLPPGSYAIAAFHDENGNTELDTNLLGMPTEGYGFSNDAHGFFGPASFDSALITVEEAGADATLTLAY